MHTKEERDFVPVNERSLEKGETEKSPPLPSNPREGKGSSVSQIRISNSLLSQSAESTNI
jgi:hypothetical protein